MDKKTFPRFRRRKYFIKKGLQARFVLGFCSIVLLGFLLNLAVAYFLIDNELARQLYGVHLKVRSTSAITMPILMRLAAVMVPFIVIVSAMIGYYLTQRTELPLHSFRNAVRKASLGDLRQEQPEDMTGELPEAFNKAVGSLEAGFRSLKRRASGLEKASDRLASVITGRRNKDELSAALDDMASSIKITGQEIVKFKV